MLELSGSLKRFASLLNLRSDVGLHRTYYSGIEREVRNVSLVNIEKIAKGLKRSLPDLFGRI